MNRVFLKGDCHGRFDEIVDFIETYSLDEGDYIIVVGDMALFWRNDRKDADYFINFYEENYKVNLWFIDGNHENFKLLNELEIDEKGLGTVSPHIKYLPRGLTFELCGKRYLCMGGADSVDRFRRIKNYTWWEEEKILPEDIAKVDKSLYYDIVLTHAAPQTIVGNNKWQLCMLLLAEELIDHSSEQRLEELMDGLKFGHWYFGHYHADVQLNDKFTCLLHDFIEIE